MNELSIIIPCISSIDLLQDFMDELAVYLMANPSDVDVIVVANENVQHTGRLVHHVRTKYPWLKFEIVLRKGGVRKFGALARFGIACSMSRYAVLVSPHGEDDISLINPMLSTIRKGYQVIQVNRYARDVDIKRIALRARVYQVVYRALTKALLGYKISDSTYHFKMFDRVFIQAIGLNQNGYAICPEITLKTLLARGRVEYISSATKSVINKDFKLRREGLGYLWLLVRGAFHRIGVHWF